MSILKWLVGGVIGAFIGIALWAAVVHFSGYEVGLVAALVGIFVGAGVAGAAGADRGRGTALFAALLAFFAVMGGKTTTAWIASQQYMGEVDGFPDDLSEEFLVSCVADEVVIEYQLDGVLLEYPAGADLAFPDDREDYPADVWAEAEVRWSAMSAEDREAYRAGAQFGADVLPFAAFLLTFIFSFGLLDLLWIALAVTSAYRIAEGSRGVEPARFHSLAEDDHVPMGFLPLVPGVTQPSPAQAAAASNRSPMNTTPISGSHDAGDAPDPIRRAG